MTTTQNTRSTSKAGQNWEVGTLVHVAPDTLLMTKNIREAKPSVGLIKSVAEVGVLETISAVIANDGADLLVRFGHRRTLAAIEAKAVTVPVYIVGIDGGENHDDAEVKADEIARVIGQRDENTHRDGLTTANEAGVVQTLTSLGLSAAQITKQARIPRAQVDAAIAVNKSELAVKAAERYDMTLDQLAVIAEFEDDADTIKALVAAATINGGSQFDHVAARAREDRAQQHVREALVKDLAAAGLTILDSPSGAKSLHDLRVSAADRTPLSKVEHEDCPGHVAWIGAEWIEVDKNGDPLVLPEEPQIEEPEPPYDWRAQREYENGDDEDAEEPRAAVDPEVLAAYDKAQAAYDQAAFDYEQAVDKAYAGSKRIQVPAAVYGCKGWAEHGHFDPFAPPTRSNTTTGTDGQPLSAAEQEKAKEKAKKDRRLVIDNNKAWDAANEVRREFVTTLAKAKMPPKGTQKFLAAALVADAGLVSDYTARALAGDWLGFNAKTSPATVIDKGTDNRALVIALVRVLAAYEAPLGGSLGRSEWRRDGTTNATGRYLRFLASVGYNLSDVEKYAITKKTV